MNEVASVSFSGNPAGVEGAKSSQGEGHWPLCWFTPGPLFLCLSFSICMHGSTDEKCPLSHSWPPCCKYRQERESPGKNGAQDSRLHGPLPCGWQADSLCAQSWRCRLEGQTLPISRTASLGCPALSLLSLHLRSEGLCPNVPPALGFGGSFALFGALFHPVGAGEVLTLGSDWDLSPIPATCLLCHLKQTPYSCVLLYGRRDVKSFPGGYEWGILVDMLGGPLGTLSRGWWVWAHLTPSGC